MTQNIEQQIIERLPDPTPRDTIVVEDESHLFQVYETAGGNNAPKTVYVLDKVEIEEVREVRAVVDDSMTTLQKNTDWELRDVSGSGTPDAIAFIDSSSYPDEDTEFFVTYVASPLIKTFTDVYSDDVGVVSSTLDTVIDNNQVANASGTALDQISNIYGPAAVRGSLGDDKFRSLIQSVVPALSASGTIPGMKVAVAAVLSIDPSDVTVNEDFTQTGYRISFSNTRSKNVSLQALNSVIELADPSGVELLQAPIFTGSALFGVGVTNTQVSTQSSTGKIGGETLGSSTI